MKTFTHHTLCLVSLLLPFFFLMKQLDCQGLHWPMCTPVHSCCIYRFLFLCLLVSQVEVCLWALCAAGLGLGWPALRHLSFFSKWAQSFPGSPTYSPLHVVFSQNDVHTKTQTLLRNKIFFLHLLGTITVLGGQNYLWHNTSFLESLAPSPVI